MVAKNDWPCWEITGCENQGRCSVRQQDAQAESCWEIARRLDDYRNALNVCRDCIVYLAKHETSVLSEQEIKEILHQKTECVLVDDNRL